MCAAPRSESPAAEERGPEALGEDRGDRGVERAAPSGCSRAAAGTLRAVNDARRCDAGL
jgi:hypothetical protein